MGIGVKACGQIGGCGCNSAADVEAWIGHIISCNFLRTRNLWENNSVMPTRAQWNHLYPAANSVCKFPVSTVPVGGVTTGTGSITRNGKRKNVKKKAKCEKAKKKRISQEPRKRLKKPQGNFEGGQSAYRCMVRVYGDW